MMNSKVISSQFCRTCAISTNGTNSMKSIFSIDEDFVELNIKLYTCVPSIKIDEPNLPKEICEECIVKLRNSFEFKQQCLKSTRILLSLSKTEKLTDNCKQNDIEEVSSLNKIIENDSYINNIFGAQITNVVSLTETSNTENCNNQTNSNEAISNETSNCLTSSEVVNKNLEVVKHEVDSSYMEVEELKPISEIKMQNDLNISMEKLINDIEISAPVELVSSASDTATKAEEKLNTINDLLEENNCVDDLINENIVEYLNEYNNDHNYYKPRNTMVDDLNIIDEDKEISTKKIKLEDNSLLIERSRKKLKKIRKTRSFAMKKNIANIKPEVHISRIETNNDKDIKLPYICTMCDTGFRTTEELKLHLTSHLTKKIFICKKCGKVFPKEIKLMAHQCSAAPDSNLTCPFCFQIFTTASALINHKFYKHLKVHSCTICFKYYSCSQSLRRHMKIHEEKMSTILLKDKDPLSVD